MPHVWDGILLYISWHFDSDLYPMAYTKLANLNGVEGYSNQVWNCAY